jgi:rhamnose transport system ATP-binding protein
VPEDRRGHGVIGEMTLVQNTSLASLDRFSQAGLISRRAERRLAEEFVDRFAIKASSVFAPVRTLSGGNQQKVSVARWLATDPILLILDEPTQGVDVGSKAEIHALMRELAARGLAIIMISSELPEALAMSDRILVMRGGRISGEVPREEATEAGILWLALGQPADSAPAGAAGRGFPGT